MLRIPFRFRNHWQSVEYMADVNGLLSRQQLLKKKINRVKCEHKPAVNRVSVYPPPPHFPSPVFSKPPHRFDPRLRCTHVESQPNTRLLAETPEQRLGVASQRKGLLYDVVDNEKQFQFVHNSVPNNTVAFLTLNHGGNDSPDFWWRLTGNNLCHIKYQTDSPASCPRPCLSATYQISGIVNNMAGCQGIPDLDDLLVTDTDLCQAELSGYRDENFSDISEEVSLNNWLPWKLASMFCWILCYSQTTMYVNKWYLKFVRMHEILRD